MYIVFRYYYASCVIEGLRWITGPTEEVLSKVESPLQLFLFFLPCARESNRYYQRHLNERVDRMYQNRVASNEEVTREAVLLNETEKKHKTIKTQEIIHCIGLFIARMLCPHKRRFADHWTSTASGAVPKRTFGQHVSKARFGRMMHNLHFTDNTDARSATDRA
ncbi:hypothetical protein PHMEG_00014760 [Phytophthora megakarya]|uniref:Uncharacterized protein n=1 Tax=Phytophthora megakarya TaxID=4795 RepID=A0A225W2Z8_9STRA|nr:hypothetical protein PHMEG_00014760 [Phytophthora megakarya]